MAKAASGIASVTHSEAVEVALCYGWIDGQVRTKSSKQTPNRLTEDKAVIERNLKTENAKLTALTKKLAAKLKKPEAKALARAQASWAAWRDAEAEYVAYRYAPTEASSPEILSLAFDAIVSGNKDPNDRKPRQTTRRRTRQPMNLSVGGRLPYHF
jgi:uncharacterized protein YdeI (YjbR/CyaY-like superfamily)